MDLFMGQLWYQRMKQALLQNGVAVLVLSGYYFDGWDFWTPAWRDTYDKPV